MSQDSVPSMVSSKAALQDEQEFVRSLLAQNRAALQQVLTEISERILETSMQQMKDFQSKVTERQGDVLAQQKKEDDAPPPQMIGAGANGKWTKNKWKKNRDGNEENDTPAITFQPTIAREVHEYEEPTGATWSIQQSMAHGHHGPIEVAEKIFAGIQQGITGTRKTQAVFCDSDNMKARLRAEMSQPIYDVTNFYTTTGIWQAIARSHVFENMTLCVIAFNAIWIAVDVDLNDASVLHEADPIFIVVDNFFCIYFVIEITIRFRAFAVKRNCLRDIWFIFDTFMASLMVLETWILTFIFLIFDIDISNGGDGGAGNASVLRVFRFARLVRLARVMHVCRALPELMVVIKGMAVATRAVSCTVALMLLIVYVFAVLFRQLTDGSALGERFFESVPIAMRFLLLHGTTPDLAETAVAIWDEGAFYAFLFLVFILVVTITVMNMLVGVLVGVVQTVSAVEKEGAMVAFMKNNLLTILNKMQEQDEDHNGLMSKDEFTVLLENKDALRALGHIGVDVIGLLDLADFIFRDGQELPYQEFMELVMQLRGSNTATVKDIVDLRKFIAAELEQIEKEEDMILDYLAGMSNGNKATRSMNLKQLRKQIPQQVELAENDSPDLMKGYSQTDLVPQGGQMGNKASILPIAATESLYSYSKKSPRSNKEDLDETPSGEIGARTENLADAASGQRKGKDGRKPFKRLQRQSKTP